MAYPVAMETLAALPRDIWERTPPEAQAYIGTLEARVATLEDRVRTLQEQLNQSSRNSSRPKPRHGFLYIYAECSRLCPEISPVTLQIKPHRFLHIVSHTHSLCHAPHVILT